MPLLKTILSWFRKEFAISDKINDEAAAHKVLTTIIIAVLVLYGCVFIYAILNHG